MGQKVHPVGIRLGISKDWSSKWYSNSAQFPKNVNSDFIIRKELFCSCISLQLRDGTHVRPDYRLGSASQDFPEKKATFGTEHSEPSSMQKSSKLNILIVLNYVFTFACRDG